MSATATFEFHSHVPVQEIKGTLQSIWAGDEVDVLQYQEDELLEVSLCYYTGRPSEEQETAEVAAYLMSIAIGSIVYYFRDRDSYVPGSDPDYEEPISVNDIMKEQFQPGMHNGIEMGSD